MITPPKKKIKQYINGTISYMFECMDDPVVQRLLLKSSVTLSRVQAFFGDPFDRNRLSAYFMSSQY